MPPIPDASPTVGTTAAQVSVTIQTVGPTAANHMPLWPGMSKALLATLLGWPMFVLAGSSGHRKRRLGWIGMGAFFLLLLLLSGCGSSAAPRQQFTTPGTYAVQMTISVGSTQGSATLNMTVTQ